MMPRMPERSIEADVAVIGGGAAGIAAAITASRSGARVVILDRYRRIGGTVARAGVDTICGLYAYDPDAPPRYLDNGGFASEFARRLIREYDLKPTLAGAVYVLPCPPEYFVALAEKMMADTNVELILNCAVESLEREGRVIKSLRANRGAETIELRAASFVDASGDAIIAALAGEQVRDLSASQAAGYIVRVDGVVDNGALAAMHIVARACREGRIDPKAACVSIAPWSAPGSMTLKFTVPADATIGRACENARQVLECLRAEPGWQSAKIIWMADEIGTRTGCTIIGRNTLTRSDVISAAKFPNASARGAWPIEIWTPGNARPHLEFPPRNDDYEIPAECLRAAGADNLFAAGRCISADAEALASARVIATAMDTGRAAAKLAMVNAKSC